MRVVGAAQGFFILTASSELQTAKEALLTKDGRVMGHFTAALVDALESGAADTNRSGHIRLSDLRRYLDSVVAGQTPQFFAQKANGDPVICLSPSTKGPLFDESILIDLVDNRWHRRLGAVTYLLSKATQGSDLERKSARQRLSEHLQSERDAEIRARVEQALLTENSTVSPYSKAQNFLQPSTETSDSTKTQTVQSKKRISVFAKTLGIRSRSLPEPEVENRRVSAEENVTRPEPSWKVVSIIHKQGSAIVLTKADTTIRFEWSNDWLKREVMKMNGKIVHKQFATEKYIYDGFIPPDGEKITMTTTFRLFGGVKSFQLTINGVDYDTN